MLDVPLALNYRLVLGKDFIRAREDIRPFLPSWAAALNLRLKGKTVGLEGLLRPDGPVVPNGSSDPDSRDQVSRASVETDGLILGTTEVLTLPELNKHLSAGAGVDSAEL